MLPITTQSLFPSSRLPDLHRLIPGAGGDALAIGRPGYCSHTAGMAGICVEEITISGIPDLYRLIITCRGDTLAIGRPRHGINKIAMAGISVKVIAVRVIPDLHRFIV